MGTSADMGYSFPGAVSAKRWCAVSDGGEDPGAEEAFTGAEEGE